MVPTRKQWLLATTAAVLVTAAGCSATVGGTAAPTGGGSSTSGGAGSDGGGAGSNACGSDPGFCITVDITGAATLHGNAHMYNGGTCADYAKNGSPDGSLQLPGLAGEKIGGREITQLDQIEKYAGPGTYGTDKVNSVGGALDIDIDNTPYQPVDGTTTAQAVINADGSGSFTFAGLKEGEQGNPTTPKGVISGSFTWTCSD